jgi:hypothetical protein
MACCVIAALVLAILHRLTPWRRRTPDIAGFAPQASRPAPGQVVAKVDVPQPPVILNRRVAALAWVVRFVAVGAAVYLSATALLVRFGVVHSHAPVSLWLARTLVIVAAAAIAMLLSANIFRRGTDLSTGREIIGYAAIGFALMAIEGMAFDMHLLSIYHVMDPGLHHGIQLATYAILLLGIATVLPVFRHPSKAV